MKNKKKIWIASFICVGAGIILLILGMVLGGRPGYYVDRSGIHSSAEGYSDDAIKAKKGLEAFEDIEIAVEDADIEIVSSDQYAVEYYVSGSAGKPQCTVENGKLVFKEGNRGKVLNFCIGGWNFDQGEQLSYYVKIYMPLDREYHKLMLSSAYGNISVPALKADAVRMDSDDGDLSAAKINADSLQIDSEYGKVEIKEFNGKQFSSHQQDGRLAVTTLNAEQAKLYNEYGNTTIRSGKGKSLISETDDGDFTAGLLDFEKTDIQDEYGNVTVGLPDEPSEYSLHLETEYGQIGVDGYLISSGQDEMHYQTDGSSGKQIKISCDDGDITVTHKR